MDKTIRFTCTKCDARFAVDAKHGGRMGRCARCNERFILPIPSAEDLLAWAESTTWSKLTRFVDHGGASGHSTATVDKLVEIVTKRRWAEEHKTYREASPKGKSLTRREQIWESNDRKVQRRSILEEVISFSSHEFEKLIADIFSSMGMTARAVGGSGDDGIDVKIWDQSGEFLAIAQCKRYADGNKVSAPQIREFAGAFMLSKAKKGYFFTTSSFTKGAEQTAQKYPWLTIYDGKSFVKYIEKLKYEIDRQTIRDRN